MLIVMGMNNRGAIRWRRDREKQAGRWKRYDMHGVCGI